MGDRAAKDALFDAFAEVAKALASGRRAEIVDVLAQGERSRRRARRRDRPERRQHLAPSPGPGPRRACCAPDARAPGSIYRLASDRVGELWAAMRDVAAEHVAGIDELAAAYLGDRDRPRAGRPGASSSRRLRRRRRRRARRPPRRRVRRRPHRRRPVGPGRRAAPPAQRCSKDIEVVAYCRGPYCVYADDAVRQLRRRGYRARRLEDGFPEWKRAGLPVAAG